MFYENKGLLSKACFAVFIVIVIAIIVYAVKKNSIKPVVSSVSPFSNPMRQVMSQNGNIRFTKRDDRAAMSRQ